MLNKDTSENQKKYINKEKKYLLEPLGRLRQDVTTRVGPNNMYNITKTMMLLLRKKKTYSRYFT